MKLFDDATKMKATWIAMQIAGRFSAKLSGALADELWFRPWRIPLSERALLKQEGWLSDTSPVEFVVGDRIVRGFRAGEGPAVLLIHGWGERAAALGAFVGPLVRSGRSVVGIDLPAHGATRGRRTDAYEMSEVVGSVGAELGEIDAIIGHSMGATTTILALGEGLKPRAVVLFAPSGDLQHVFERFRELFALPPRAAAGLRASIERRFGPGVWTDLALDRRVLAFDVPALVIHDRDDPQIPVADSERLAAAWPGARLEITNGLGHSRTTRDGSVVHRAVSFIEGVSAGGSDTARPREVGHNATGQSGQPSGLSSNTA